MKKIYFCVSLALAGLMSSCVEKYEEVDAESKPEWLGSSIYTELQNPREEVGLQGTFKTYLRLIDDLGEAETLNRTGSKTVFPANDEAFERFFANNSWKVRRYEDLSIGKKKLLLYSSMLDNPLLLQLLPNVSNGTAEPQLGGALKHATNVSVIDSVNRLATKDDMPANNPYWEPYYATGIDVVTDATSPMMVHLTREYMLNNGITTDGDQSDFAILTGTPYPEGQQTAYIFNNQVKVADVTCLNGYIHQMSDVVVPPGNMPQVMRDMSKQRMGKDNNISIISRVLDYFAVPVEVPTTTNYYNAWARTQSPALPDKTIYAWRYLSSRSYDSETGTIGGLNRIAGRQISTLLNYDPGWNQYYQKPSHENIGIDYPIMDMGAFFAPTDKAMAKYFTGTGEGAYLIETYGTKYTNKPNNEENLIEHLDSIHSKNPQVLTAFVNNLLKSSFASTVPSKFESVPNDAGEFMGLSKNLLVKNADGKYDISFANNGAIYVLNELLPPDEYQAVLAPASVFPNMKVMNWAIQDRTPASGTPNKWSLQVDFKYYLLSMSTNYAFFIPTDEAFATDCYYLDPTSLKHKASAAATADDRPEVLHFFFDDTDKKDLPYLKCERHYFDMNTGTVTMPGRPEEIGNVRTQLVDILNYHTVVLPAEKETGVDGKERFKPIGSNGNHYFQTKHGGTIYVDGNQEGGQVMSGLQISNNTFFPNSKIEKVYSEKNGYAYSIDHVIQPPVESVYKVLKDNAQFAKFLALCEGFRNRAVMEWAGITTKEPKVKKDDGKEAVIGASPFELYQIFVNNYRLGGESTAEACLDYNVRMFNTYNYTLFAPNDNAMDDAYSKSLPKWEDINALFNKWLNVETTKSEAQKADSAEARRQIDAIHDFICYHFSMNSVYADNSVESGRYKTLVNDDMGVAKELNISGGGGALLVRDGSGNTISVSSGGGKVANRMTRDYWLGKDDPSTKKITAIRNRDANAILTSSFCAVHEIDQPLCSNTNGTFFSPRKVAKSKRK